MTAMSDIVQGENFTAARMATRSATILPDDARILVSDCLGISERSASRLRFLRTLTDGNGFEHCSPGSRAGITTNSESVTFNVYYNNLVTRADVRNYVGGVLVDGVLTGTFTSTGTNTGPSSQSITVSFATAASRTIELVWPYGDGMDLISVQTRSAATLSAPSRPAEKMLMLGDSITHGFWATNVFTSWAHKLAVLKTRQLLNLGYGSRMATATDGNAAVGTGAGTVLYLIGYNDFVAQTALALFKIEVKGCLQNLRAALPAANIYAITPLYSANTDTLTLANYRTQISDAVTELADAAIFAVDGLSVMTNLADRLQGGIHPNNTGAAEIATNLDAGIV